MGDPFNFTYYSSGGRVFVTGLYSADGPGSVRFRDTKHQSGRVVGPFVVVRNRHTPRMSPLKAGGFSCSIH
jgi:hypothetical protein